MWVGNHPRWYEQRMVHCDLCGKIIPRDYWGVHENGKKLVFCDPDCEQLYREYWLPSQRPKAPKRPRARRVSRRPGGEGGRRNRRG